MDIILVKVKRYSENAINEIVNELAKNTYSSNFYFNNRFNYSNRIIRYFQLSNRIQFKLKKFIKTLMNTKVAVE
jgi:hypothetical protein